MELSHLSKKEEDGDAIIQMWKYVFSFTELAAIKCVIELKIADIIECHGSPMTLSQLSSTLNCASPSLLYRILRFLVHREIFKEETTAENLIGYAQTPLSRLLITNKEHHNMSPLLLLETSPIMLEAWHNLSGYIKNSDNVPFEIAHGKDLWSYAAENPKHNLLVNEAMACSAQVITKAMLEGCGDIIFNGVETLVDVGGGNGTTLSILVKACPWIRGINFDLPHVVSTSSQFTDVEHVAGNMFNFVPKADVAFLKVGIFVFVFVSVLNLVSVEVSIMLHFYS